MTILLECNQLKESFADSRDSTDPLDSEKLLTEYRAFFNRIQHNDDIRTTSEIQAICDLNIVIVRNQLKAQAPTEIDQHLTRAAIDWNFEHQEKIDSEALVSTFILRAYVDLIFDAAALSKMLADLDEALAISYCSQTCAFSTVAEVYNIRASILEKMRHYVEAREAKREAVSLSKMEDEYQKLIRSITADSQRLS